MNEMLQLMAAPLVACVLLSAIHGYLGIHVVRRGVIFVDIALAQMAALGAAMGEIIHIEPESYKAYILSLGFTFAGAIILALVRRFERWIPSEAFIGVLYVVGAALVILIMDRAPHGVEHVKELMVGQILWVQWGGVLLEVIVYGLVGLLLIWAHKTFYAISCGNGDGKLSNRTVFLFDVLFYTLFGTVVTISVRVAGVLLVFTYLVVPAIIAALFLDGFKKRFFFAWILGSLISLIGVSVSYIFDFPTGAAIVACAGGILVLSALARAIWHPGDAPAT